MNDLDRMMAINAALVEALSEITLTLKHIGMAQIAHAGVGQIRIAEDPE
jgi:hypothetical protein